MGFVLAALKIRLKIRMCNSIHGKWAMVAVAENRHLVGQKKRL
jgi:hypothetical protein